MAFEIIRKGAGGNNSRNLREWTERPCVGIGKTVLSFNKCFEDMFAGGSLTALYVLFDEERRTVGFKVPSKDQIERDSGWYAVGRNGKKSSHNRVYLNGCPKLLRRIRDCVPNVYRATLNPEGRIIEVRLHPENMAK